MKSDNFCTRPATWVQAQCVQLNGVTFWLRRHNIRICIRICIRTDKEWLFGVDKNVKFHCISL